MPSSQSFGSQDNPWQLPTFSANIDEVNDAYSNLQQNEVWRSPEAKQEEETEDKAVEQFEKTRNVVKILCIEDERIRLEWISAAEGVRFAEVINEFTDQVRALGYGEAFIRMWEFYLCYCEGGFLERAIGNVQLLMMRPDARPVSLPV